MSRKFELQLHSSSRRSWSACGPARNLSNLLSARLAAARSQLRLCSTQGPPQPPPRGAPRGSGPARSADRPARGLITAAGPGPGPALALALARCGGGSRRRRRRAPSLWRLARRKSRSKRPLNGRAARPPMTLAAAHFASRLRLQPWRRRLQTRRPATRESLSSELPGPSSAPSLACQTPLRPPAPYRAGDSSPSRSAI